MPQSDDRYANGVIFNRVQDPGDAAKAISVDASGVVALVTAGAETRTLTAPTFLGQTLQLDGDTLAGNCVVTVDAPVNTTGNNTLTFTTAGQTISLRTSTVAGAYVWRAGDNDGVGLTTV